MNNSKFLLGLLLVCLCFSSLCVEKDDGGGFSSDCVQKDDSCCSAASGLCNSLNVNCVSGNVPVFTGCNDKCLAQGECQSDICTKKLSAGPSEEERKECADAGGAIAVGGDGSRCVCKCRDENVPCTPGTIPCCQGLTPIQLSMEQNGQCITASCGSICKPCGNGVCDSGENKCNCPVDCGKSQECNRRSDCCCKGVGGGDCKCKVPIPCPQGNWPSMSGCDSECQPIIKCASCAGAGEKVYGSADFGPTNCCSKNDGIKPTAILNGDTCMTTNDGSLGTCISGWWQTCPDGICGAGEDKCNCPQDCKGAGGQECVDPSDCVVAVDLGGCCACPGVLPRTTLDASKFVVYESGKDYSRMLSDECRNAVCSPCGPVGSATCQSGKCVNAPVCGNIYCERGEDAKTCPQDCGTGAVCGNGFCEAGENKTSCLQDCAEKRIVCGDHFCTSGENESNCPVDCGSHRPVCGNGFCEKPVGENATNCALDCEINSVCGNLACEEDEDRITCPQDCADHT